MQFVIYYNNIPINLQYYNTLQIEQLKRYSVTHVIVKLASLAKYRITNVQQFTRENYKIEIIGTCVT